MGKWEGGEKALGRIPGGNVHLAPQISCISGGKRLEKREKLSEMWALAKEGQLCCSIGRTTYLQISPYYQISKGNLSPYGLLFSVFFLMSVHFILISSGLKTVWCSIKTYGPSFFVSFIISCVVLSLGKKTLFISKKLLIILENMAHMSQILWKLFWLPKKDLIASYFWCQSPLFVSLL